MEDEIDASPTKSQRKRKIKLNCHSLRKIKKPDGGTTSRILESQSDDCKTFVCDGPDGPTESTNGASNCLTRRDILRNVHLLETADKATVSSQKVRTINRLNNNRRESRFGFLNVTEHSTQEPSTAAIPTECASNSISNNVTETQFDLTESQISRIDIVERNYYDSVTNTNNPNDQLSVVSDETNTIQRDNEAPHDSTQLVAAISPNESTDEDSGQNSLKRCRSTVQSILDEWPTSPEKKKACVRPEFSFNRKLTKKTYQRQCEIRTTFPQLNIVSPGAVSITGEHADDYEAETICEEVDQKSANDEEVDLNESIKVIDNIQCLSKFYSQPEAKSTEDYVNETFKTVLDSKSLSSTTPSRSHIEKEDFYGFDGCDDFYNEEECTLSERFDRFGSDSDDSTFANQRQCSFLEDDENLQTCSSTFKEQLLRDKLPKKSVRKRINSCITGSGVNELEKGADLFADIEKEYNSEIGRPDECFDNLAIEFASMQKSADMAFHGLDGRLYPTYTGFSTALGRLLPFPSALIAKMIFKNLTVSEDDLKYSIDLIGETRRDSNLQADCSKDTSSKEAVSKRCAEEISYPTNAGISTVREHNLPVISKKNIFQKTSTEDNIKGTANWIGDTGRDSNRQVDCLSEISSNEAISKERTDVGSHTTCFTTALGRHLSASSELISKKTNIFENITITEDDYKETTHWIGDIDQNSNMQVDFLRRSSSNSSASKESMNVVSHTKYAGFSTARGRHLPVSPALISKKANIFQNVTVTEDDLKGTVNSIDNGRIFDMQVECLRQMSSKEESKESMEMRQHSTYPVFKTARGHDLPVSSALISKKTNIFENVLVDDDVKGTANWIGDTGRNSNLEGDCLMERLSKEIPTECTGRRSHSNYAGFTTARGHDIPVSSALISKKTNIFQNVTVTENDLKGTANWIDIGRNSHMQVDCLGQTSSKEEASKESTEMRQHSTYPVFKTARGHDLPVSSALISKKTNIFENVLVTEDDLKRTTNCIGDNEQKQIPVSISLVRKSTSIFDEEKMSPLSTECFREMTNSLDHPQRESNFVPKRNSLNRKSDKSPINTFVKPSPLRKLSMVNSLRKLEIESAKENVNAESITSIHTNNNANLTSTSHTTMSFISPIRTPTSSISHVDVTPTNNPISLTQEVQESVEAIMTEWEWDFPSNAASSTPIMKTDTHRNRPRQTRLVEKFNDIAGEDYFESSVQFDNIKVRVPNDIISLRKIAFETQRQSITEKNNVKPVPSTLYVTKLASSKLQWKDFVGIDRPKNRHASSKTNTSVEQLTAENATKFKINAWDHYSAEFCRENVNGIYLKDDIVVIMDENCRIGLHEISNAFLSCPSVDPKLIHDKWIENHYKWILIKLAGMERSFPHIFSGRIVTLENVMLQLKYRYDREIDQAERPAIRKICEMDDIPAKRMILFVARITRHNFAYEVELSDGWYSLTSIFDKEMTRIVDKGKIKVGTKLMIQGAELTGLDSGCHPLDKPGNVRLMISANSTRRCRWDSKLGYCKNSSPFRISLPSVLSSGGNITKLRIYVLRVYPVVYFDTKNSDTHSEKVERRRIMEEERSNSLIGEKVYSQVLKEYEAEQEAAQRDNCPNKIPKPKDICTITDPATLCYLLNKDIDPTRIEYEMTESQRKMVMEYRHQLECLKMEAIRARVNEKLSSIDKNRKKFVPLLKFKVIDYFSFDTTATVTIWRPSDDDLSMIQEGSVYEMIGTAARGASLNELQIYVRKNSIFKKLNIDCPQLPRSYSRRHTSISEIISVDQPVLNELDTTGYVVHVGDVSTSFHPVYIADSDQNILCIYFWNDIKNYAYDDVVLPKRFLAIKNLQWRPTSNSKTISCLYAMDFTIFTENPKSSELLSAMTNLKEKFLTLNMDEFMETCMEKINSSMQSPSLSMQSPASSIPRTPTDVTPRARPTLSNQSRIERLSIYGEPMATPPLQIKSINLNYKEPCFKN